MCIRDRGEEEFGEKTVCCQLVQLVGTGEDDVEKIALTELAEPWQIHPEGSNSWLWHGPVSYTHLGRCAAACGH